MRSGHWFGSVFWVSFSALTLMVGWQEGQPTRRKPVPKGSLLEQVENPTDPGSPAVKTVVIDTLWLVVRFEHAFTLLLHMGANFYMPLCVCACTFQKPHVQTLWNFLFMLSMAVAQSSLCTWGFVDDVMFGHNQPGKGDASRACTQSDSQGGSTRDEVYNCLMLVVYS